MCILEKLNFKISWGSMLPDPPTGLAPSALRPIITRPSLTASARPGLCMGVLDRMSVCIDAFKNININGVLWAYQ